MPCSLQVKGMSLRTVITTSLGDLQTSMSLAAMSLSIDTHFRNQLGIPNFLSLCLCWHYHAWAPHRNPNDKEKAERVLG